MNPNGQSTSYYFRYGKTTSYGTSTAVNSIGSGTANVSVSATLSGLEPNTTYHYKVVATNAGGGVSGEDRTLKTLALPPTITNDGVPPSTTYDFATVNGSYNPNGSPSQYYFQYGTTINYGTNTAIRDGGSGTAVISVSEGIQGLKPFTTYHYRLVVVNGRGTFYGSDHTFRTKGAMPWIYLLLD